MSSSSRIFYLLVTSLLLFQLSILIWTRISKFRIAKLRHPLRHSIETHVTSWGNYRVLFDAHKILLPAQLRGAPQRAINATTRRRPAAPVASNRTYDVTLATQLSIDRIHQLRDVMLTWDGPVSAAILVRTADQLTHAVHTLSAMRRCGVLTRDDVGIHLVIEGGDDVIDGDDARAIEAWERILRTASEKCGAYRWLDEGADIGGGECGLSRYPHNVMRNVARRAVLTSHVLTLDVDVTVSVGARREWMRAVTSRPLEEAAALVLPAFEVREGEKTPVRKVELVSGLKEGKVRVFHQVTCPMCHKATNYDDWIAIGNSSEAIGYELSWKPSWEPFYIATTDSPAFDERFTNYGYDRISQICELYMAGYKFHVLSNSFVVHNGFKEKDEKCHEAKMRENQINWNLFSRNFMKEMKMKYPNSGRNCLEDFKLRGKSVVSFNPRYSQKSKSHATSMTDEL